MSALARLNERNDRLQNSLSSSIEHFRNGEDSLGFNEFMNFIEDLESVIDLYQYLGEPNLEIEQIIAILAKLYFYMQNQDIVGIADLLEFTVYPLSKKWFLGCDKE